MKISLLFFFAGIVLFTSGCGCSREPINPEDTTTSDGQNLILNGGFEDNIGQQSLKGWIISDTALISFSQDTPPRGGSWSIELQAGSTQGPTAFEGFAETYITGQSGTNIYQLNVWMKSLTDWPGRIIIGVLSQNQLLQKKETIDTATTWTQYTLIDTLVIQISDTIVIHLTAGSVGSFGPQGTVLFDLIEVKKIFNN